MILMQPLVIIYVFLLGIGIARAFNDPASSTLLPETVAPELFARAATWTSSMWQLASILGPAAAGIIVGAVQKSEECRERRRIRGAGFIFPRAPHNKTRVHSLLARAVTLPGCYGLMGSAFLIPFVHN
jgi:MFS family permease